MGHFRLGLGLLGLVSMSKQTYSKNNTEKAVTRARAMAGGGLVYRHNTQNTTPLLYS